MGTWKTPSAKVWKCGLCMSSSTNGAALRLGVRLADHAYMFPEGAEVGACVMAARMQGGVLCWVRTREVSVPVEMEGDVADVVCEETVWVPVGDGAAK